MLFENLFAKQDPLRRAITAAYRQDENECVLKLLKENPLPEAALQRIHDRAHQLVKETRQQYQAQGAINKLLHQFDLASEEGLALMCLAEALLRIPDQQTRDLLISDKLSGIDWSKSSNKESSLFGSAASWSLLLTGKIFSSNTENEKSFFSSLKRSVTGTGIAAIRPIITQSMKMLGTQFVTGQNIEEALKNAGSLESQGYRFSYDMLGEAARTAEDAQTYFESYQKAIIALGESRSTHDPITSSSISIKLSALHPRYEYSKEERVRTELIPSVMKLILLAKQYNVAVTIDAEEADRLDISLDIFETLFSAPELTPWEGLGLVVQAYQKRAPYVIDWLHALSQKHKRRIPIRLVKGAYWDAEIKQSQIYGFANYPVFTRKASTDLSYLVCAKKLLDNPSSFYPQFGTHNAHSVASILDMAGETKNFEFQCLHGMGRPLYDQVVAKGIPVRIYAPVGNHQDLVGYLVRRLLENGANTSFINQVADEKLAIESLIKHPTLQIEAEVSKPHPRIPLPPLLYPDRKNSSGPDLSNRQVFADLEASLHKLAKQNWYGAPLINGKLQKVGTPVAVISPRDDRDQVGQVYACTEAYLQQAVENAAIANKSWAKRPVSERAACLEKAADLFQEKLPSLVSLLCREGGKSLPDSISEVRETIDFCRYYALRAREDFKVQTLNGPTGELNQLSLHPRGLILCISPWNFPLAIFTGQVVAALACGNTVIAKPAEQTALIATLAIEILHEAGIPKDVVQLTPGRGSVIGPKLLADLRVSGVMFTGSTEVATLINQTLANRGGPIVPLIAETGGLNAMIVDSSALPEQVVADALYSAFNSAGQRCSALRILFVQEEGAPRLIKMLKGAMAELKVGDPADISVDLGPVIDEKAKEQLLEHVNKLEGQAELLYEVALPADLKGSYFAPRAYLLKDLSLLKREVFGPILHVLTYPAGGLSQVLDLIRDSGYGLTLGIHSRIEKTARHIEEAAAVGNVYVNRNMIGAVVGVQPFGGECLSGTGPKAGGPHYLPRLCVERSLSINTTAVGGNTTLVTLKEEV